MEKADFVWPGVSARDYGRRLWETTTWQFNRRCERLRLVANGCVWLRFVAFGCVSFRFVPFGCEWSRFAVFRRRRRRPEAPADALDS